MERIAHDPVEPVVVVQIVDSLGVVHEVLQFSSFDLILSNEAILYAEDKVRTMTKVAQLLTQDGYLVIGDIIEAHAVNREEMKGVYERLGLPNLGDGVTYDRVFT